jgi:eukaryotic-like serine/threonine-protein kinase
VKDLARGTWVRVSREGSSALLPVWSPDSTRLTYVAEVFRSPRVTIAAADGTRELATVPCPTFICEPTDWSRDGRWILVNALDETMRSSDVWMLPAGPATDLGPLLTGPFVERDARLSPDGHFIAYVSDEVGHPEISIRTMGAGPQREVVSVGGGSQPVWTRDGRELLFVDREGMLRAVPIRRATSGRPVVGNLTRVAVPPLGVMHYSTQYDISADGRRIYFLDRQPRDPPRDISVIVGWRELIN